MTLSCIPQVGCLLEGCPEGGAGGGVAPCKMQPSQEKVMSSLLPCRCAHARACARAHTRHSTRAVLLCQHSQLGDFCSSAPLLVCFPVRLASWSIQPTRDDFQIQWPQSSSPLASQKGQVTRHMVAGEQSCKVCACRS